MLGSKGFWNSLSISRKSFIFGVAFLALFSLFGEGSEHIVSDILHGNGQMLSDGENLVVWFFCIFSSASIGCFFLAFGIKILADGFTNAIRHFSSGERSVRVSDRLACRGDEIGLLARTFNEMADRIEQEEEREKLLLASVSHELRSPLTRMSVALELLKMEKGDSPQISRIESEIERMEELIRSMLEYSRLEMVRTDMTEFNLPSVLRGVIGDARFEGEASGCDISADMPEKYSFVGNAAMLAHAVENVLRNSLKYAGGKSGIRVSLIPRKEGCSIIVRDYGPGVPEKNLMDLFIPFFRVDSSRTRDSGGTGMGLAIAENVVRAHHGSIHAENADGGGLMVVMDLPLRRMSKS